jgi:hypothetical protein
MAETRVRIPVAVLKSKCMGGDGYERTVVDIGLDLAVSARDEAHRLSRRIAFDRHVG